MRQWGDLRALGNITLALLERRDWVNRRVESVNLIDVSQVERSVSLDINVSVLCEILTDNNRSAADEVLVPLTLLPKNLLLDLDISDANGCALSLATSDEDSRAAQAALLAKLAELGYDLEALPDIIGEVILQIAKGDPSRRDVEILEGRGTGPFVLAWSPKILEGHEDALDYWDRICAQTQFSSLLATLTINYMPMVRITPSARNLVLKYRHLERQQSPRKQQRLATFLSIEAYQQVVEAPAVGRGSREHLRFIAPKGLFLEEFYLDRRTPPETEVRPRPRPHSSRTSPRYSSRLAPERAVIYTSGDKLADTKYEATALLRPRESGFLRAAQYTVIFTALLLALGAVAERYFHRLINAGTSTEAASALLLIIPSAMSAFLSQADEHELLSDLLRAPRLAVASSAGTAILAAGALVVHVDSWNLTLTWAAAAVYSVLVFAFLRLICYRSRRAFRESSALSTRTFELDI